jgi:hypothetical protein
MDKINMNRWLLDFVRTNTAVSQIESDRPEGFMKIYRRVARLGLGAAALAAAAAGPAQDKDFKPQRASAYSEVTKWPDFSGVWSPDWSQLFGPGGRAGPAKLTPEAQAKLDAYNAGKKQGENQQTSAANCLPNGMPQIMRQPYPIEFIYSPGRVTIFIESYSQARRIYINGQFPKNPENLFNGNSIGHWEGDTLVVDTIGFTSESVISDGVPHNDKMRIEERIRKVSPTRLVIDTTITDPGVLAAPYSYSQAFDKKPDWQIREYVCEENDRDSADAQGRAHLDLGLDENGADPFGPAPDDSKGPPAKGQ